MMSVRVLVHLRHGHAACTSPRGTLHFIAGKRTVADMAWLTGARRAMGATSS
jgi:hypothetical protein